VSFAYDKGAEPLQLLAWRFSIAAVLLGAVTSLTQPGVLRVGWSTFRRFLVAGLFGHSLASLSFYMALSFADASVVEILLYTYPAIVAVAAALFFRERLGLRGTAAVVVTFIGCALAVGVLGHAEVCWQGIVLGLLSGIGYSVFTLTSDRYVRSGSRAVLLTYLFAIDAVVATLLAWVTGSSLSVAAWDGVTWILLGLIIAVPTLAATLLYLQGVRGLGSTKAALVSTSEPAFTVLLAALFLGERLTAMQWIGAVLVLGGVVLVEWRSGSDIEGIAAI